MDDSILAKFPDDDHALGPFLGNLPPEILDVVVEKLGWFQTTFAMAGRTCREVVARVPRMRAVLTEEEREELSWAAAIPLAEAVIEGDVEALGWLIQLFDVKGLKWRKVGWLKPGSELFCLAAGRGNIESMTCLRANGCPWDAVTCANAAYGGHLEVLQWAHQNGCPWDAETCGYAAKEGHLEILQWAHQNGCPWDWKTSEAAARRGHLEILQWARQNGCPWDEYTCSAAAGGGHLEVLKWLERPERVPVEVLQYTRGTSTAAARSLAIWRYCSGRVRTGARGTCGRARPRRSLATWRC